MPLAISTKGVEHMAGALLLANTAAMLTQKNPTDAKSGDGKLLCAGTQIVFPTTRPIELCGVLPIPMSSGNPVHLVPVAMTWQSSCPPAEPVALWWKILNTRVRPGSKNAWNPSPVPDIVIEVGAILCAVPVAVLDATWKPLLDPLDTKSPVARTALTAAQPAVVVGAVELNDVPSVEYESVQPAGKVMSLALVSLTLVGSIT